MTDEWYVGFLKKPEVANFGHKVIAAWNNSDWCHSFSVFREPYHDPENPHWDDSLTVYETSPTTYERQSLKHRMAGCEIELYKMPTGAAKAIALCKQLLGKWYDYLALVGFAGIFSIQWLYNWLRFWDDDFKRLNVPNLLGLWFLIFCSESVRLAMLEAGLKVNKKIWRESIDPHRQREFVKANYEKVEDIEALRSAA